MKNSSANDIIVVGMKRLTKSQMYAALSISSSIVGALVLVFSILALNYVIIDDFGLAKVFLALALLTQSVLTASLIVLNISFVNNKIAFIKYLVISIVYFLLFFAFLFLPFESVPISIACGVYMLTILANRVCKIFEKRKPFNIIFNAFLSLLAATVTLIIFAEVNEGMHYIFVLIIDFAIFFVALINILMYAFSKIQLGSLLKIIRKTHVIEAIYGLLILIITFSFIFTIYDPVTFPSYGDAIWYCFAVVTTIGFGDFAAVDVLCRVLTVIIGLYGIIVVALVTSVVVNFYSEVKNKPDDVDDMIVPIQEDTPSEENSATTNQDEESHS